PCHTRNRKSTHCTAPWTLSSPPQPRKALRSLLITTTEACCRPPQALHTKPTNRKTGARGQASAPRASGVSNRKENDHAICSTSLHGSESRYGGDPGYKRQQRKPLSDGNL